jgi:DNA-binding PadR family transcriptional regulator
MKRSPAPESFLPLKPNWFHVLLSLSEQDQHGYAIMQDVLERTDGKVRLWPPTLYGTIKRLIDEDLIGPSDARPAAELDDSRRRYYRLTSLGRRVLSAECARLEDLIRAVHARRGVRERKAHASLIGPTATEA